MICISISKDPSGGAKNVIGEIALAFAGAFAAAFFGAAAFLAFFGITLGIAFPTLAFFMGGGGDDAGAGRFFGIAAVRGFGEGARGGGGAMVGSWE